jgi:hypothetical protein
MKEIKIRIDTYTNLATGVQYCANCHLYERYNSGVWFCHAFKKHLKHDKGGGFLRLPECLEAEVKE